LKTEPFATELKELAAAGARGLFYNSNLELNQGAYLTECTPTLLSILARAYRAYAGKDLPLVDVDTETTIELAKERAFTIEDALDGLFLDRNEVADILLLWRAKKNIVLQGPPGVGKSFAAQRLAYALMGARDKSRVGFVQFHQSYSYEDFVEGFRPAGDGFHLQAGKFVRFCREAEADQNSTYVFIIDEINRGNLSKILGELMLLVEPDKRDSNWAISLASGSVPFFVPANVFLIGLMNTADRSLAVVDYALRRRFAFVDLGPKLRSPAFREHVQRLGVEARHVDALVGRIESLNSEIVADVTNLGLGFAIGHSFFCGGPVSDEDGPAWYRRIMRTEILPLLREYWFDAPLKVSEWEERLLAPL
jgi:MoxR-like ATPase